MKKALWLAGLLALASACGDDADTGAEEGTTGDGLSDTGAVGQEGAEGSTGTAVQGSNGGNDGEGELPPVGEATDGSGASDGYEEPVFCTLEVREPDGICPDDPCDPDCQELREPVPPGDGDDGPIACAQILMLADGVCDESNPCAHVQDEDCINGVGGDDDEPLICPAIYIPPDGVCPPDEPCDPDC